MSPQYSQRWDLDRFFPDGSRSEAFQAHLERTHRRTKALGENLTKDGDWTSYLDEIQDIKDAVMQANSFVHCLTAQDVEDEPAKLLVASTGQLDAAFQKLMSTLDQVLLAVTDEELTDLAQNDRFSLIGFSLAERRRRARRRLAPEVEAIVGDLSVDGYHAWGELYQTVSGRIRIPWDEKGKNRHLSAGQAANKLSDPDRQTRMDLFSKYEQAWADQAELCAQALNHIGGYRLNLYRARGWDSILEEPLDQNRVSRATLDAMWSAVVSRQDELLAYFSRKAKLLGLDSLAWFDIDAPLGEATTTLTYDEAAQFVIDRFRGFSPKMAGLAQTAIKRQWIEAEDRAGKRVGGFCTRFPLSGESRVFMTFDGLPPNVSTLAHELGHAFHGHVMKELPAFARVYPMTLAETASTFAETMVGDAALQAATGDRERLLLLDGKLQRTIAFLMNIYARFVFEQQFYEARARGAQSIGDLNQMMQTAQKEAYHGGLGSYHPLFWASKLHFYLTHAPFYNFPYTFGYLFSLGLYARALEEGRGFEDKYVALLADTGTMTAEDLARRHLGIDLTSAEFWNQAVGRAVADVDQFMALTGRQGLE